MKAHTYVFCLYNIRNGSSELSVFLSSQNRIHHHHNHHNRDNNNNQKKNDHDNNRSLCAWFNVIANGWIFKRYTWCFDQRRMFIENTFSKWNYSLFLAHNGWFQEKPAQYYTIKINNNISVVAVKSVPPKCMIEKSYRQNQMEERKKEFLKTHYNRQCFICSISIGLSLYDWNAFYPAGIIQPFNEKKERQSGHWTMDMDRKTNVKWTWA